MSERNKSLRSFCFEAFEHLLLHIKLDRGLLMSVRVLKPETFLDYYVFKSGKISMQNY